MTYEVALGNGTTLGCDRQAIRQAHRTKRMASVSAVVEQVACRDQLDGERQSAGRGGGFSVGA